MPQHADTKADMTQPRENPRAADCAVLLDNVVFAWPGQQREVLRIPYLAVPRGEHVFISGPSGSGKSTLLSLVAGILRPSSGQVFVNGVCPVSYTHLYMTYQWWIGACNELVGEVLSPITKTPEYKYVPVRVEKIEDQTWAESHVVQVYSELKQRLRKEKADGSIQKVPA